MQSPVDAFAARLLQSTHRSLIFNGHNGTTAFHFLPSADMRKLSLFFPRLFGPFIQRILAGVAQCKPGWEWVSSFRLIHWVKMVSQLKPWMTPMQASISTGETHVWCSQRDMPGDMVHLNRHSNFCFDYRRSIAT